MSRMKSSQIARRYAEALFTSISPSSRQPLLEEFKQVLIILDDVKVHEVFTHPRTSVERKSELIRFMGLSKAMENFLLLTVEKSREQFLTQIEGHFHELVLEAEKTALAEVVTAIPLAPKTIEQLKQQLQNLINKTVLINTTVDPRIGGGMIIKVDGKVIDGSVQHSLKRFQQALSS